MQATLPDPAAHPATLPMPNLGLASKSRLNTTLGRIGSLEVRLARNTAEIAAAQEVRYRVFYDELGARHEGFDGIKGRDADRFDEVCDHLLVFDSALPGPEHRRIVGTYRILRQEVAADTGGFYSQDEFDLTKLIARHPDLRFVELGRSCVLPEYRAKRTIEVLWQGIWSYVSHHRIDVMTGCASFQGADPALHAQSLSFLAYNCRADSEWDARAVPERYHRMDLVARDQLDLRSALHSVPPLIKGYMRVGARVGDGCVVDYQFDTVDVLIVLPVRAIDARYINYYSGDVERAAA